jgi:hypothetical protein
MCRIGTFGAADEAMALSDEFIEVDGFATPARKSATPARKPATPARKSATAARKPATRARKSATPARKPATRARKPATRARKPATTARKAATGAVRVTTKADSGVLIAVRRGTLVAAESVRRGSGDFDDEPLVTRGLFPVQQFDSNNHKGELT